MANSGFASKQMISRHTVAEKLAAYLREAISLPDLVTWAETAMMEEDFEEANLTDIRDVIARLGLADVRAFGLTWKDCQEMLRKLGYTARVEIVVA